MTKSEIFVKAMIENILVDGMNYYKEKGVNKTSIECDDFVKLYNNISEENQTLLLSVIKSVIIDNMSAFFGILDGTTYCDFKEDLILASKVDNENLNGYLQDLFFQFLEENYKSDS